VQALSWARMPMFIRRDWTHGYGWPADTSFSDPRTYANYQTIYAEAMREVLAGRRGWHFTPISLVVGALVEDYNLSSWCERIMQRILPMVEPYSFFQSLSVFG
jgi:hypothetical protein